MSFDQREGGLATEHDQSGLRSDSRHDKGRGVAVTLVVREFWRTNDQLGGLTESAL
jgi:hypothetical protein